MTPPRKGDSEAPPAPAEAASPERRNIPADETFPLSRYRENPGSHAYDPHILDGAAALAGWDPHTELTKSDLAEGVRVFLNHPVNEEG